MRMQANLNIGERFNGRGIIYVKRSIAQEVGILIVVVLVRVRCRNSVCEDPAPWRGAALERGRSISLQQAAPGTDPSRRWSMAAAWKRVTEKRRRWTKGYQQPFAGAACCKPIELPTYKAAPFPGAGYPQARPAFTSLRGRRRARLRQPRNGELRTINLQSHPDAFQVIASREILRHWHLL